MKTRVITELFKYVIIMENKNKEIILNYLESLDGKNYDRAEKYLHTNVKVIGPAGEGFTSSKSFLEMLSQHAGKYDIKKVFVDGNDVCVLYDFITPSVKVFMSSWYQLQKNKIHFIQTIFDSKLFV